MFAVAGLSAVTVYELAADGTPDLLASFEYAPSSVVAIEFVRDSLAILSPHACEIVSLASKQVIERYRMPDGEVLRSMAFVEHQSLTFVLVSGARGQVAVEPVLVGTPLDTVFQTFVRWSSSASARFLTACPALRVVFSSGPGERLEVYHVSSLFENPARYAVGFAPEEPSDLRFLCQFPGCPSVLLFQNPQSGLMRLMEFTDGGIEMSALPLRTPASLFGREFDSCGFAPFEKTIAVVHGDASISLLAPRAIVQEDRELGDMEEYRVPLTFWNVASIATQENSSITGTDPSQNYGTLYSNSPAYFHQSVSNRVLTVHVSDPQLAIVGVMIWFERRDSGRPNHIVVKGRKYATKAERTYLFPLMPSEVRRGEKVDLVFLSRPGSEIGMQGAVIFVMKWDAITPFVDPDVAQADWFSRPVKLTDFQDSPVLPKANWEIAALEAATAITVAGGDEVPQEMIEILVRIMYRIPWISLFARSALIRIVRAKPEAMVIWIAVLGELIRQGEISKDTWKYAWRDFALLEPDIQRSLQDAIWARQPPVESVSAVVSAFAYRPVDGGT
jgi:hypothetical protein